MADSLWDVEFDNGDGTCIRGRTLSYADEQWLVEWEDGRTTEEYEVDLIWRNY